MRLSRLSPSRVRSQTKLFMNGHDLNPLVDCLGTLRQPSAKSEGESLPHKPSRGLSRSKERLGQKKKGSKGCSKGVYPVSPVVVSPHDGYVAARRCVPLLQSAHPARCRGSCRMFCPAVPR